MEQTNYVYWLGRDNPIDKTVVGSKAANLWTMAQAGFPTPSGFCLSTLGYQHFIDEARLYEPLESAIALIDIRDAAGLELIAGQIHGLISGREIPNIIADALSVAYRTLGEMKSTTEPFVAVRSAALAEDQAEASYAGLYDSYLNVNGFEGLLTHVNRCWSGLWTARAIHYRLSKNRINTRAAMSVIVQAMAPSTSAGVLFTTNPVTGRRDEIVINSSWGLADAVVSGLASADTFIVDKSTLALREITLGQKASKVVPAQEGGTVTMETLREDREQPSLASAQLRTLTEMALGIERHFGAPQDIEWAFDGDALCILQTRPLTTLRDRPSPEPFPISWDNEEDKNYWWAWDQIHYPRPLSPLYASIIDYNIRGRQRGNEFFGATTGPHLRIINGYRYIAQVPLPLTNEELEGRRELGRERTELAIENIKQRWEEHLLPEVMDDHRKIQDFDLKGASVDALLEHLEWVLGRWERHLEIHVLGVSPAGQAARRFAALYMEHTGLQEEREAYKLLQGFEQKSLETHSGLWSLAQQVKSAPELARCFQEDGPQETMSALNSTPAARSFLKNLQGFLDGYGSRFTDLGEDIYDPTWREAPEFVISLVKAFLLPSAQDPQMHHEALVTERAKALEAAYQRIGPDVGKRKAFDHALELAQNHLPIMENHHFYIDHTSPALVRYVFMEFGSRLAERGKLEQRQDVMFLTLEEIKAAIRGSGSSDIYPLINERRRQREEWLKLMPLPGVGTPILPNQSSISISGMEEGHDDPRVLRGIPSSSGVVTGTARVIMASSEFNRIQAGNILVCQSILPQWTPLFSVIAGLVTNAGSALQHGAILAREYRIPSVDDTRYATQVIKDGQRITVDGTAGLVYLDA